LGREVRAGERALHAGAKRRVKVAPIQWTPSISQE
jgi:hypothetical protein